MSERVNTLKIKREFELKKQSKGMSKNTQNDHINIEQSSRHILWKRCSENMQQIYRRPMPNCDFNRIALQLY